MTAEGVLLVFLICIVTSGCILLLVEPLRRKFMRRVEYDVQDENPWDEMLSRKKDDSHDTGKGKRK